jgi:hypothetical protein
VSQLSEFAESQAVHLHLNILQAVIQRMSENSVAAKTWCITLVSAILVLVVDKSDPKFAWLALIPTFLFFVLDTYYLALERRFRNYYNEFIKKIHSECLEACDLFVIRPEGHLFSIFLRSICSFSIWPFYAMLVVIIGICWKFVLH